VRFSDDWMMESECIIICLSDTIIDLESLV